MVRTSVSSINQASEWGDIIIPLENIMKCLHSALIHHDKNNSNGPNFDPTAYPTTYPTRKSITKLARNNISALIRLPLALFHGESWHEAKEMIEKRSETHRWDQIIRTVYLLSNLVRSIPNKSNGNDNNNNENNNSIDSYYYNNINYHDVPIHY